MTDPSQAPRRLLCIVNQKAQDGAVAERWPRFSRLLEEAGFTTNLVAISRGSLVEDLASHLGRHPFQAVLGIGGDGTHMSVINALKDLEGELPADHLPPYLIIPFGTGNNVGKSLGLYEIRRDWSNAVPILLAGRTKRLDLGTWAGGYFADAISIGLDPDILACRDQLLNTWPAWLRNTLGGYGIYAIAGIRRTLHRPSLQCDIEVDGDTWYCGSYTNLLINNTRIYGGVFDPTPSAEDDDGFLDISLITNRLAYNLHCLLSLTIQPTFMKQELAHRLNWLGIRQTRCRRCRINLEPPASVQVDGEFVQTQQELQIGVEHQALTITIP